MTQEIFIDVARGIRTFRGDSQVMTWVYRIAHNIATSHVIRQRRKNSRLLSLEEIESVPDGGEARRRSGPDRVDVERLFQLVHQLNPPDRELMLLYLEDLDAQTIGEIMGTSAVNVRSKIHRIKTVLTRRFHAGGES